MTRQVAHASFARQGAFFEAPISIFLRLPLCPIAIVIRIAIAATVNNTERKGEDFTLFATAGIALPETLMFSKFRFTKLPPFSVSPFHPKPRAC